MEGRDAVLDFGGGNVLRVEGVRSLNALRDDLSSLVTALLRRARPDR